MPDSSLEIVDPQTAPPSGQDGVGSIVSIVGFTSALVLAVLYLAIRFVPSLAPPVTVEVVSFDVIKYTNAQRAVASAFLSKNADVSGTNELLLNVPERTRDAIREVAGDGTLVMLKQAVVQGQTRDITDDVLKKLGLPVNVPTSDAAAYTLDMAPTLLQNLGAAPVQRRPARPASGTTMELP